MAMFRVLLQAGHQNIKSGQTGAPEEMANNIRVRDRLGQILISKGFQVFLCDANFKSTEDFNLALALHCDANYPGNEGGGFVDYPDPSVDDSNVESKRIKEAIESEYFKNSGIRNMPARSNPNTKFYYWWSYLTAKTPCVILEMGESIDPRDKVILADTYRVANAIARGICKAFNVQFDQPQPVPSVPPTPSINWEQKFNDLQKQYDQLRIKRDLYWNFMGALGNSLDVKNDDNNLSKSLSEMVNKIQTLKSYNPEIPLADLKKVKELVSKY